MNGRLDELKDEGRAAGYAREKGRKRLRDTTRARERKREVNERLLSPPLAALIPLHSFLSSLNSSYITP